MPLAILILVFLAILPTNFAPGTWLTGWDNLHPEFDFLLNVKRSLSSVWQEYQGLGLLGGMGHAADFPRQLFLWLMSAVIPNEYLRYFFHFLMLGVGTIGVYFLIKNYLLKRGNHTGPAALIGAVFYLLNLATLQMFYVPFEPYSVHFAFLPWLFLVNLKFWQEGGHRALFFLFLVNILAIPQGYVITYFVVYFLALSFLAFFSLLQQKFLLRRLLLSFLLLIMINAFWLLPNVYFIFNNVDVTVNSKINQMTTETNFLQNQNYGGLENVTLLRGFWFDIAQANEKGETLYLMQPWIDYFKNPLVVFVGYLLFIMSLSGLIISLFKREKRLILFIPITLFSFTLLANNTPGFSFFDRALYQLPLFAQAFRFPFTKFGLLLALGLALFYAGFYNFLVNKYPKFYFKNLLMAVFLLLPIIFLFPVFQGHLFYRQNKVSIPEEYFQVFDFFKEQNPNTRIANFPQPTYWGWESYRWGPEGSGFLWYGIRQPLLDRAFDVWSREDENYYWEISRAIYSKNQSLFEGLLEKYQINWLLLDRNVNYLASPKALYLDEFEEMLKNSPKVTPKASFGKIKIYQVNLKTPVNNFVFYLKNAPDIQPAYRWNDYDQAFLDYGHYLTSKNNQPVEAAQKVYYPFRSLFTGKEDKLPFQIETQDDSLVMKQNLDPNFAEAFLQLPEPLPKELWSIDENHPENSLEITPDIHRDQQTISLSFPQLWGYYGADIQPTERIGNQKVENCNPNNQGQVGNEIIQENRLLLLRLKSQKASNCSASFWLQFLPHSQSYLISFTSRNISGRGLLFWLENSNNRKANLELYLPKNKSLANNYFIQPPMEEDGVQYALHFDNISLSHEPSVNDLGEISVNQIPYRLASAIKLTKETNLFLEKQELFAAQIIHPNTATYVVKNPQYQTGTNLVLSQSYQEGWGAYLLDNRYPAFLSPVLGQKLDRHLLINNWANGWQLSRQPQTGQNLVIYYFPQYWEYFGFLLGFLSLGVFLLPRKLTKINE